MGFFGKIFKRSSVGNLSATSDFWYSAGGGISSSGKSVTKETALRLWAVFACVSLISETIASLPLKLKRVKPGGGTEDAVDHPLFDILKYQPNPEMTSFSWREAGQVNLLTEGNKYSFIERNLLGIKGLWPIESRFVSIRRAHSREVASLGLERGGGIVYDISLPGDFRTIPSRDMLHVPGLGFNGIRGESIITNFARETIGMGLSLNEFEGKFFKNGIHTSGVIEHPKSFTGTKKETFLEALKQRYMGGGNAGRPMVLEDGMTWNQMKISLIDQQFLELLGATDLQICGIFKVPPSKISIYGKGTSYNNSESQNSSFWSTTISPWVGRDEQSMAIKLLTKEERAAGLSIKYNFDALLRPNAEVRAKINHLLWQMGMPLNVLLNRDDINPVEGGDVGYVPANFIQSKSKE